MFRKKLINDAGGVIALLFRRIIKDNNLIMVLESLVDKYVDNKFTSTYDRTAEKTNYMTTIKKGKMTLNKFIEMFKTLFDTKYLSFTIETEYNSKIYTGKIVLDLKKDNLDTVYLLFQELLKNGLQDDLKSCIEKNIKNKSDKAQYIAVSKIKNVKMTWKTLVELLSTIYGVSYIKITCNLEYGRVKKTVIEEASSIRL